MANGIVFTGGGSAGHVTPNMALIPAFIAENWRVDYIGSQHGVEKKMISGMDIPYHEIRCGKLRRYFSWKNFFDPINTVIGIVQSIAILLWLKPRVVFSKGGFVAFPVVFAAWLCRIPVIAHESDFSPGLANRLSFPFARRLCVTFAAAKNGFKHQKKIHVTGTPIRSNLFSGSRENGLLACGFNDQKSCVLMLGGGQGSKVMNACLRAALDMLGERYQVVHLCGAGQIDPLLLKRKNYFQIEYADDLLADLYAMSDLVISRAGANTVYELLALNKPHIFIPLSRKSSRGDQIQNAEHFCKQGISRVIYEEALNPGILVSSIEQAMQDINDINKKIKALNIKSATDIVVLKIKEIASQHKCCD